VLFHGQFAAWIAQPVDRQHGGNTGPGYIGIVYVQMSRQELSKPQLLPQLQAKITVGTVSTSDQYPCSLPSLSRECSRRNISCASCQQNSAVQDGWSALHQFFH